MHGELPEIYWYLFWIGFVILAFRMAYLGGKSGYDTKMKAIEILKMYAEKGTEPPPAMMEQLATQAFTDPGGSKPGSSAGSMMMFLSMLFMACVAWGVRAWSQGHPVESWVPIAATAALAFFGIGAAGFLVAALVALVSQRK
jgi:hypothetical protein